MIVKPSKGLILTMLKNSILCILMTVYALSNRSIDSSELSSHWDCGFAIASDH